MSGSAPVEGSAWQEFPDEGVYERYWDRFYETFRFEPSVYAENWPAIAEPRGSITFDLSPVFGGGWLETGERRLNQLVHRALVEVFPKDTRLVVLDWHHPCFWFWPNREADSEAPGPIQPFPDGDYYIFLTEDFAQGTFGHPWEQTYCVFGDALVANLAPKLSTWLPVARSRRPDC